MRERGVLCMVFSGGKERENLSSTVKGEREGSIRETADIRKVHYIWTTCRKKGNREEGRDLCLKKGKTFPRNEGGRASVVRHPGGGKKSWKTNGKKVPAAVFNPWNIREGGWTLFPGKKGVELGKGERSVTLTRGCGDPEEEESRPKHQKQGSTNQKPGGKKVEGVASTCTKGKKRSFGYRRKKDGFRGFCLQTHGDVKIPKGFIPGEKSYAGTKEGKEKTTSIFEYQEKGTKEGRSATKGKRGGRWVEPPPQRCGVKKGKKLWIPEKTKRNGECHHAM